jgi:hypothetical protein
MFNLAHGESGSAKVMEEEVREALGAFEKMGLKAKVDSEIVTKVVGLIKSMKEPDVNSPWTERVNEVEGVSYLAKQQLLEFMYLMTISDKEFESFLKNYRDLRKTLRSTLQAPIEVVAKA